MYSSSHTVQVPYLTQRSNNVQSSMAMQFLIAVFHCLYTFAENILIIGIHLKSISSFLYQG